MRRTQITRPTWPVVVLSIALGLSSAQMAESQPADDFVTGTAIADLRNARDTLIDVADFAAAIGPAETIVAELESQSVSDIGDDILRLARIQGGLGDFEAAEFNYLKAIDRITADQGAFASLLVGAHQGLGRMYINARRFPEALGVLEQARSISRRNDGLFNVGQSGLFDDMTTAHLGTGNTIEARDLQLGRLDNAIRQYGEDDARLIPFHIHLGDYFDNSRLKISARAQYAAALELSEATVGQGNPGNLDLLRRLTAIDLLLDDETTTRDEIEKILNTATDINTFERGLSLATLGDWAIVEADQALAATHYAAAYRLLEAEAGQFFAAPKMLNFVAPLSRVDRGARSLPWTWGNLVMEFEVSADGRASNVETITIEPRIRNIETDYNRRIREAYFRPRLDNGRPVDTVSVRYSQDFRYYVDDD